jgi:hypothetical protein
VTEDRPQDVRGDAVAERTADIGWEPSDWSACLRRLRRTQLATVIGLVVLAGGLPVLWFAVLDQRPSLTYWFWASFTLVFVAENTSSLVSATGRVRWERETRQAVRTRHALRHHTSIGAADRALVTARARTVHTWAKVAFVAWPLLGIVLVAGMLDDQVPASLGVPLVLLCLLLVGRAVRRSRLARRWLADPLPRDERTPWT